MKKLLIAMAIVLTAAPTIAQTNEEVTLPVEKIAQEITPKLRPSFGDYFEGFTRKITYDRMIPPYGLEVTFEKTIHIIFPASIIYVDLGSSDIIAGKAQGAENVLRVKAAVRNFESETNLSVVTDDGSFYSFNVKYVAEPEKLNIEMKDFVHDGDAVNRPNNSMEIYLTELANESPKLVNLINRSIYNNDRRHTKHIGSKRFGVQYLLKGIYSHNGLLYLHTQIRNESNVPFDVDFVRMKIVDKKVAKRTAIQETVIYPLVPSTTCRLSRATVQNARSSPSTKSRSPTANSSWSSFLRRTEVAIRSSLSRTLIWSQQELLTSLRSNNDETSNYNYGGTAHRSSVCQRPAVLAWADGH